MAGHKDRQQAEVEGECEKGGGGGGGENKEGNYEGEQDEEKGADEKDRGDSVTVPLLLRRRGIPS